MKKLRTGLLKERKIARSSPTVVLMIAAKTASRMVVQSRSIKVGQAFSMVLPVEKQTGHLLPAPRGIAIVEPGGDNHEGKNRCCLQYFWFEFISEKDHSPG